MKIRIKTTGKSVNEWDIESAGPIEIDIAPNETSRIGPGGGNGFLGPECIVQMFHNGGMKNQIVGFRIVPDLGRDDSQYFMDVANPQINKV